MWRDTELWEVDSFAHRLLYLQRIFSPSEGGSDDCDESFGSENRALFTPPLASQFTELPLSRVHVMHSGLWRLMFGWIIYAKTGKVRITEQRDALMSTHSGLSSDCRTYNSMHCFNTFGCCSQFYTCCRVLITVNSVYYIYLQNLYTFSTMILCTRILNFSFLNNLKI